MESRGKSRSRDTRRVGQVAAVVGERKRGGPTGGRALAIGRGLRRAEIAGVGKKENGRGKRMRSRKRDCKWKT